MEAASCCAGRCAWRSAAVRRSESVCYERSETAAGFSAEDLKRAEAQWREQGSPKGLTSD